MQDTFELKHGDQIKVVTMHYALLDILCRKVGDLETAALLSLDNEIRQAMIQELLVERNSDGTVVAPLNVFSLPYSIEQIAGLLGWAQEHIFDFFVKAAAQTDKVARQHEETLKALKRT